MTVYTLFGQAGGGALQSDTGGYQFGMQFTLSQPAQLTGVWFYSAAAAAALPWQVACWLVTGGGTGSVVPGTQFTGVSWSGAAGTGWIRYAYASPVTLSASTSYKISVGSTSSAPGVNWYSANGSYWVAGGAGQSGLTSGIITAPNSAGGDGGQDTYTTTPGSYPATSFSGGNYWVDLEVTTSGGGSPNVVPVNAPESAGVSGWVMLPARGRTGSAL